MHEIEDQSNIQSAEKGQTDDGLGQPNSSPANDVVRRRPGDEVATSVDDSSIAQAVSPIATDCSASIDTEPISIPKPEGSGGLDKFKSKRPATIAGVETLLTGLPHHSISEAKDFVRLHPDESKYWSPELCFVNVPIKGQKRDTLHSSMRTSRCAICQAAAFYVSAWRSRANPTTSSSSATYLAGTWTIHGMRRTSTVARRLRRSGHRS